MFIDKQSPLPAYYQLKTYITEMITTGQWEKDRPIPSERELSEQAKISRMTVRQAINELVNEGLLYRLKGKGTYITMSKIEQKNIMSFSEMIKNKGITPVTEILNFQKALIMPQAAKSLYLILDTKFYGIKRLRKAGDMPVAIEEVFIPENYCPNLEAFNLTGSLYQILLEEYQYKIEKLNLDIDAVLPGENERALLQINKNTPLLKVSGNSTTSTGLELLYETSFYRSDQFTYKVNVFNRKDF